MSAPVQDIYSRRLLLHPLPFYYSQPSSIASSPSSSHQGPSFKAHKAENSFDANIIMVLSVLFCALVCSVGFHFFIRCLFRCTSMTASRYNVPESTTSEGKGVNKKALKAFPTILYSTECKLPGLDTECAICLSDFASGERVKLLPKCNHGFHVKCIDNWLSSHSTCPKCRRCLIETCEKIVGCSQAPVSSMPPVQVFQEIVVVSIVPLQPEGFTRNYREN